MSSNDKVDILLPIKITRPEAIEATKNTNPQNKNPKFIFITTEQHEKREREK